MSECKHCGGDCPEQVGKNGKPRYEYICDGFIDDLFFPSKRRQTMTEIKETVRQRASRDPEFRNEILKEALEAIDCGDTYVAKALISDCIGEACHLTEHQKKYIRLAYKKAEFLSKDGYWQDADIIITDSGSTLMWQLEQAFPFLWKEVKLETIEKQKPKKEW